MSRVNIAGELSIYQVSELKPQFQQALDQANRDSQAIELELSQMSECDGAGLQLLLSLGKSANEFETAVHLINAPPALLEMLSLYGLSNRFVAREEAHE